MLENTCDICYETIKGQTYALDDDMACESCYMDAVDRAEYLYEMSREEGLI